MQRRNKLKELSISMAIGLFGLVILIAISGKAITAYLFGQTTYGEVIEYTIERNRPANYSAGQYTPELHQILIEYSINSENYWVVVNSHVYSAIGHIQMGDRLLVSYSKDYPENGYVISYALFSTLASILVPFVLLILLIVTPQLLYHYRKQPSKNATEHK